MTTQYDLEQLFEKHDGPLSLPELEHRRLLNICAQQAELLNASRAFAERMEVAKTHWYDRWRRSLIWLALVIGIAVAEAVWLWILLCLK